MNKILPTLIWLVFTVSACMQEPAANTGTSVDQRTLEPNSPATSGASSEIDMAVPDLSLPVLGGGTMNLAALKGKVLVVNFWATWCGPCRVEMPDLIELHESYQEQDFSVIGIATDIEGEEIVAPFVEEMGITFPTLLDDGTLSEAFGGVFVLPTTFVIDKQGMVKRRTIGLFPVNQARENLEAMMAGD